MKARKIPESKFNWISSLGVFFAIFIIEYFSFSDEESLRTQVEDYLWMGFTVSFTLIGLLIAGFTIFSTVGKPELFLAMAEVKEPRTGLPKLKYNYFIFIRVFCNYFSFLIVLLFLGMISGKNGFIENAFDFLYPDTNAIEWYYKLCSVLVVGIFYVMVVQLKSFVFNIYHSVMTSLVWHANFGIKGNHES
ncbi:hypothetical protein [Cerasicoccus arenae]|nr:hypothetical protein [Cerasicoccus arenae]